MPLFTSPVSDFNVMADRCVLVAQVMIHIQYNIVYRFLLFLVSHGS